MTEKIAAYMLYRIIKFREYCPPSALERIFEVQKMILVSTNHVVPCLFSRAQHG